jgi:hypothetical protein
LALQGDDEKVQRDIICFMMSMVHMNRNEVFFASLSNMAVVSRHNKRRRSYFYRAVLDGAAKKG